MSPERDGELPESTRHPVAEPATPEPKPEESDPPGGEASVQAQPLSNAWLLLGIFLLVTIGVLMLLIFASGGNADSSMML